MEGQGITNYDPHQPSYRFSGRTNEFEDQLIKRKIVSKQQVYLNQGMSASDAERLASTPEQAPDRPVYDISAKEQPASDDSSSDDEFGNDEFLQSYRRQRILELQRQQQQQGPFGEPVLINRTEWKKHVNEASRQHTVVVCLTSSDTERTGNMEAATAELAKQHPSIKFVHIDYQSAIPGFPLSNLPCLFVYQNARMQHELLRLSPSWQRPELEHQLSDMNIL